MKLMQLNISKIPANLSDPKVKQAVSMTYQPFTTFLWILFFYTVQTFTDATYSSKDFVYTFWIFEHR